LKAEDGPSASPTIGLAACRSHNFPNIFDSHFLLQMATYKQTEITKALYFPHNIFLYLYILIIII
jgi:hypothetical protein